MYWRKIILAAALSSVLDVSSEPFENDVSKNFFTVTEKLHIRLIFKILYFVGLFCHFKLQS